MKFISKPMTFLATGSLLMLASCANEAPWSVSDRADGRIMLNLIADSGVSTGTRADDDSALAPNVAEFSVTLKSVDGSYSKEWQSLSAFNKEEGFPMGSYLLSASFGNMDQEGFNNPYYYGETPVSVLVGQNSDATITATLANAMVSLRFTDEFSQFFPGGFSGIVKTEGHDPIPFAPNESRAAYISTGNVDLQLSLTNETGKTVTVTPASFTASPKTHYIVKFGVEGNVNVGQAHLTVEFSEEVVTEKRDIFLTDELFEAPEPEIKISGYKTEGEEIFEMVDYPEINPEFQILAFGGIDSAILKFETEDGTLPDFLRSEIELVKANDVMNANLKSSGIDCAGFSKESAEMAVVNFKQFIKNLAPGTYQIKLKVLDSLGRPATIEEDDCIKITVKGLEYNFVGYQKPDFMSSEIIVAVATNSEIARDQFKFRSYKSGIPGQEYEDVTGELIEDKDVKTMEPTLPYVYNYKLKLGEIDDWKWSVTVQLGEKQIHELPVEVNMPEFSIETDAFATWMRFRVKENGDEKIENFLKNHGKIYQGSNDITALASYNEETKIYEINSGIEPNQTYSYSFFLGKSLCDKYKDNISFITESATDVPNGDFSETDVLSVDPINVGGKFRVSVGFITDAYQITSSISRFTPKNWATLNDFTCYKNASEKNTWFLVPSTFVDENVTIIRSVGYSHSGTAPSETGGQLSTTYYCTNVPSDSELEKISGELFLGSYSFIGNPNRVEGINHNSRPSSLKFDYQYTPVSGEMASVEAVLLDENEKEISKITKLLGESVEFISEELIFPDYEFGEKASKIKLNFKSTAGNNTPIIKIPTGSSLNEGIWNIRGNLKIEANSYHAFAMGSELRISNVHLQY